jgi:5-methylcytosine-specific restriction endonuclease McrA
VDESSPDINGEQSVAGAWQRVQPMGVTPRESVANLKRALEAHEVREKARAKRARKQQRREERGHAGHGRPRKRISRAKRERVYLRDGYRCVECGAHRDELPLGARGLGLDHVIPVVAGGDNSEENLQTMCGPCNCAKGNKLP